MPFMGIRADETKLFTIVKIWQYESCFTTSTTLFVNAGFSFALNGISDYTTLSNVFDQYRIRTIEVWFVPKFGSTQGHTGEIYSVVDHDDATALTVKTDYLEYTNVMVSPQTYGHYRRWAPGVATAAFNGSFGGYANVTSPWLDCASSSVQHYGLKFGSDPTTAAAYSYDMTVRYTLDFRFIH